MRTPQDIINRKEANQRYYKLEENKEQKRNYMKEYSKRDYVKARAHKYYIAKKVKNWGGKREKKKIYQYHEEWAQENGYRDNDNLHAKNAERFIDDAQR